jgi:Ca2+-binding RTX toxin-like protein
MASYPTIYDDIIHGTSAGNVIDALHGDDDVYGYGGNDTIYGNLGFDIIYAGSGNDFVDGGHYFEYDYSNNHLYGEAGDDYMVGGYSHDYMDGGAGKDTLVGLEGNDTLIGGFGNDNLYGGNGDDTLNGYGYTLNNESQYDNLTGGAGKDTFVLGNYAGVFYNETGDGYAVIKDFNWQDDQIQVKGNASQYILEYKSVGGIGTSAQDTEIYFTGSGGKERIGIVQDNTNVLLSWDFKFV